MQTEGKSGGTLRRWVFRFLLLFIILGLGLAAAELVVRRTKDITTLSRPIVCPEADFYEEFEAHGWRLYPSRATTQVYPRRANAPELSVVSNKAGFRGTREFDEEDDRVRILVAGDSFVFGLGVEQLERFTDVLEANNPSWRVDNLGMTAYGADQMLRAVQHVGLDPAPKLLLVCMYTDVFRRVHPYYTGVGYPIRRYELRGDELIDRPYPDYSPIDELHLTWLLRENSWKNSKAEWALNQAILDRFGVLADLHGFALGLVFLPGRQDVYIDRKRRSWLKNYAANRKVPFIDLTDAIHHEGNAAFIENNWHLNGHGHAVVADRLQSFVAECLELPRADSPTR